MKLKKWIAFLTCFYISIAPFGILWACACCSNPDDWFEEKRPVKNYTELIKGLRFSEKIELVDNFNMEETAIYKWFMRNEGNKTTFGNNKIGWLVSFEGKEGEGGQLFLEFPQDAVVFQTDIGEGPRDMGPLLYEEFRMEGKADGDGMFANEVGKDGKFKMVLQGRGNQCLNASDFKRFHLEITGPKQRLIFNGTLTQ